MELCYVRIWLVLFPDVPSSCCLLLLCLDLVQDAAQLERFCSSFFHTSGQSEWCVTVATMSHCLFFLQLVRMETASPSTNEPHETSYDIWFLFGIDEVLFNWIELHTQSFNMTSKFKVLYRHRSRRTLKNRLFIFLMWGHLSEPAGTPVQTLFLNLKLAFFHPCSKKNNTNWIPVLALEKSPHSMMLPTHSDSVPTALLPFWDARRLLKATVIVII